MRFRVADLPEYAHKRRLGLFKSRACLRPDLLVCCDEEQHMSVEVIGNEWHDEFNLVERKARVGRPREEVLFGNRQAVELSLPVFGYSCGHLVVASSFR